MGLGSVSCERETSCSQHALAGGSPRTEGGAVAVRGFCRLTGVPQLRCGVKCCYAEGTIRARLMGLICVSGGLLCHQAQARKCPGAMRTPYSMYGTASRCFGQPQVGNKGSGHDSGGIWWARVRPRVGSERPPLAGGCNHPNTAPSSAGYLGLTVHAVQISHWGQG